VNKLPEEKFRKQEKYRKISRKQKEAARKNIEKAREKWVSMSPAERAEAMPNYPRTLAQKKALQKAIKKSKQISLKEHRKTVLKSGEIAQIPSSEYLYLGKDIPDVGIRGYSNISEIENTLKEIEADYNAGIIGRKTVNARQMRLKAIIEQTNKGQLANKQSKVKAIEILNKYRARMGFKLVSPKLEPERPTPAQTKAAKINIKKAQKAWQKMSPQERAERKKK